MIRLNFAAAVLVLFLSLPSAASPQQSEVRGTISRTEAEKLGVEILDVDALNNVEQPEVLKVRRYAILVDRFKTCQVDAVGVMIYKKPSGIVFSANLHKTADGRYGFFINKEYQDGVLVAVSCTNSKLYTFAM